MSENVKRDLNLRRCSLSRFDPSSLTPSVDNNDWAGVSRWFHAPASLAWKFIQTQCIRTIVFHRERSMRSGGFVLACTHVSHIEPFVVSNLMHRPVRWMARREFYRYKVFAIGLRLLGAFSVNRQGIPVSSIRTAIRLAREGKVVGIFPEGGCVRREQLMFRGGRVKRGVCSIAIHASVPILPVVVLGTHRLNRIEPWLPARRGQVWVAYGRPIFPALGSPLHSTRESRRALADRLQEEFVRTYRLLLEHAKLDDSFTP